jgi:hypothetical protein
MLPPSQLRFAAMELGPARFRLGRATFTPSRDTNTFRTTLNRRSIRSFSTQASELCVARKLFGNAVFEN